MDEFFLEKYVRYIILRMNINIKYKYRNFSVTLKISSTLDEGEFI